MFGEKVWNMTPKILKILSVFLVLAGSVSCYAPADSRHKSSYLNRELSHFRNRLSTTERYREKTYHLKNSDQPDPHKTRHNRFSKLDQLYTKIADTKSDEFSHNPFKTTNSDPYRYHRSTEKPHRRYSALITTTTTQEPDLNEDYDITEDESEDRKDNILKKKDEEEEEDEDDAEEADDEADEEEDDDSDDWQAEEPTEEPTERTLTEYKWKHFGTRSRVEESRRNQGIMNTNLRKDVYEAVEHARRVNLAGACKVPKPRLIRVQNVYPETGKAYVPHCTILHRCSEETGCCRSETLTCAPKHVARVELHFYTGRPGSYSVEKLSFYNHTECHCVDRTQDLMSDAAHDETSAEDKYPIRPGLGTKSKESHRQEIAEPIKRCKCPELYRAQITQGYCRCDCQEGHRDCVRIRRGKEYFSLKDRLCIQKQECGNPVCEFGVYIRNSGRCPRRQEKLDAFARITSQ